MNQQQDIKKALTNIEKRLPEYEILTEIKTQAQYVLALDRVSKIKKATKLIKEKRDFYAKPHYNEYKRIRDDFKPFLDVLAAKESKQKGHMLAFHKEEQIRLNAEQAKIDAAALEKAKDGESVEVAVVNDIKRTEAVHGQSIIKQIKKWRVADILKVPIQFLMVDDKKVRDAIKTGIIPPGIEEYYEDSIAITT